MKNPSESEVVTPSLDLVVADSGIEQESGLVLKKEFAPFVVQAEEWKLKVASVTDPKVARASRLTLKSIRIQADKMREKLKEDSLKRSKAVQGLYNVVAGLIEPMEKTLLDVEEAAERAEAARKLALKTERETALAPYGINTAFYSLDVMPAEEFARLLSTTKEVHELRLAAEAKKVADEAERVRIEAEKRAAQEKADAEERERILIENARLKKEADEREYAAKIEREKAAALAEKVRQEREAAEAAAAKAKAESDAAIAKAKADAETKLAAERKKADDEAKAERDRVAKEKADADAKAEKERARLAEIAKQEREAREKLENEARIAREREAARQAEEAAQLAKAAAAPDKEKLTALAALLLSVEMPEMATKAGNKAVKEIVFSLHALCVEIRNKSESL